MDLEVSKPISIPKFEKISEERRGTFRSDIHVNVKLTIDNETISATSRNISKGGILIEASQEIPIGKDVFVEFTLPQTNLPMQLKGTVMWVNKMKSLQNNNVTPSAGIKFNWKYLTA